MKELYTEPELKIVCFASMQRIALDLGNGGLVDPASDGQDNSGDLGLEIIP